MSIEEKIELFAEVLDCDVDCIEESTVLEDIEEWDSVSILSFIAMMDEKFSKTISGDVIKSFVTVSDALKVME